MKLYADQPARRTMQILGDVGVLVWVCLWAWAGRVVHDRTLGLAAPGRRLQSAGSGFRAQMGSAADTVRQVPLVGDQVAGPFRQAGGAGTTISQAGTDLVDAVNRLATALGWVTALVPILIVGAIWALVRGRFIRRASATQGLLDADADLDLFALRALANQSVRRLAAVSKDPGGAWRRGDQATIRALALLELRDSGLRPPTPAR